MTAAQAPAAGIPRPLSLLKAKSAAPPQMEIIPRLLLNTQRQKLVCDQLLTACPRKDEMQDRPRANAQWSQPHPLSQQLYKLALPAKTRSSPDAPGQAEPLKPSTQEAGAVSPAPHSLRKY